MDHAHHNLEARFGEPSGEDRHVEQTGHGHHGRPWPDSHDAEDTVFEPPASGGFPDRHPDRHPDRQRSLIITEIREIGRKVDQLDRHLRATRPKTYGPTGGYYRPLPGEYLEPIDD